MKRKIYLQMRSRSEARQLFLDRFADRRTEAETVAARSACGRVTAGPVSARFSSPSFHSAAMDGLAVRAEDTFGASDESPLTLRLDNGQAIMVNTGHPLPPDRNAVIMIENVLLDEANTEAVIRAPVYPWQHVRKVGEDIVATELLFPTGHRLRPADIGALLTGGCATVSVRRRPRVTIIPTGNELVQLDALGDTVPAAQGRNPTRALVSALALMPGEAAHA